MKLADRGVFFGVCLGLLVAIGSLGLSPQFLLLWGIWTTNSLRSIGMLIVPTSLVLVMRVWRQRGWELRGTWWGLLLVALALFPIVFSWDLQFSWVAGSLTLFVLPFTLPLYVYASGVILLFAGVRVWRQAWFPLVLLLLAQPVPTLAVQLLDLPLQSLAAHIARSFATLIGFPPTNPELLRLMFTPDFGMFIAPGCDGMRGAVTLGYVALIAGYLRRVSVLRWILYVTSAVLLGHLFNLIRLCALVLYYRIAAGHPALEHIAKQADYVIGGFLFLVAAVLFLWIALRKEKNKSVISDLSAARDTTKASMGEQRQIYWKVAAFAILALIAAVPGARAIKNHTESLVGSLRSGDITPKELDDRLPKQLGDYALVRAWQEQLDGDTVLENAAYAAGASRGMTVGIWLPPSEHNVRLSRMVHGELPEMRAERSFVTARGRPVTFDTAYYSDGITDSLEGNAHCNPSFCRLSQERQGGVHLGFKNVIDFNTRGERFVSIFFRVEKPHTDAPKADIYQALSTESQNFLSNVDLNEFSRRFQ
jgi:exosortase J